MLIQQSTLQRSGRLGRLGLDLVAPRESATAFRIARFTARSIAVPSRIISERFLSVISLGMCDVLQLTES